MIVRDNLKAALAKVCKFYFFFKVPSRHLIIALIYTIKLSNILDVQLFGVIKRISESKAKK